MWWPRSSGFLHHTPNKPSLSSPHYWVQCSCVASHLSIDTVCAVFLCDHVPDTMAVMISSIEISRINKSPSFDHHQSIGLGSSHITQFSATFKEEFICGGSTWCNSSRSPSSTISEYRLTDNWCSPLLHHWGFTPILPSLLSSISPQPTILMLLYQLNYF